MQGGKPRFGALSSSVDSNQLSLTVESIGKILIGIVGYLAIGHVTNPADAQSQLQVIIDLTAQAIPMGYSLWHTLNAVWGAIRKLIALFYPSAQ